MLVGSMLDLMEGFVGDWLVGEKRTGALRCLGRGGEYSITGGPTNLRVVWTCFAYVKSETDGLLRILNLNCSNINAIWGRLRRKKEKSSGNRLLVSSVEQGVELTRLNSNPVIRLQLLWDSPSTSHKRSGKI